MMSEITLSMSELLQSAWCSVLLCLFLLPGGYVSARLFLPFAKRCSHAEQLCWSLCLSVPLALLIAELAGRYLTFPWVLALFAALAAASCALRPWSYPDGSERRMLHKHSSRWTLTFLGIALVCSVFILFWLLDVQIGERTFVPTVIADWSVRVPLVRASTTGYVPPTNPLSALDSSATPLRYYYFWYVLCGDAARLAHVSGKAALSASVVWAWFALLASVCLALRYLLGVRHRAYAVLALLPLSVIGLDLIPTLAIILSHVGHQHMDLEWWHNDRTPGFLTTLFFAPHHIAGLICCFTALSLFAALECQPEIHAVSVHGTDATDRRPLQPTSVSLLRTSILVAVCFAACVGTSTFLAFTFVIVGLLWFLDTARRRQSRYMASLAGTIILVWFLSRPFLRELHTNGSAAHGFATFAWRSDDFVRMFTYRAHAMAAHPAIALISRQPAVLLLDFFELGFFAFVAGHQFKAELLPSLRGAINLDLGRRLLWFTFIGSSVVALSLSSAVTQSANDLGMHSGMVVRYVLMLWSVPWLAKRWKRRNALAQDLWQSKLIVWSAGACLICGFLGTLYNVALIRLFWPLAERGLIHGPTDIMLSDDLSKRLSSIRSAWRVSDALPLDARVQFNPTGILQPAFAYFSNRQIVASDSGCGTSFGGSLTSCAPVSAELHFLYGTQTVPTMVKSIPVYEPVTTVATTEDFARVCRDLNLSELMATSTDHAWDQPTSWVWTVTPSFTSAYVRVFRCPTRMPVISP